MTTPEDWREAWREAWRWARCQYGMHPWFAPQLRIDSPMVRAAQRCLWTTDRPDEVLSLLVTHTRSRRLGTTTDEHRRYCREVLA